MEGQLLHHNCTAFISQHRSVYARYGNSCCGPTLLREPLSSPQEADDYIVLNVRNGLTAGGAVIEDRLALIPLVSLLVFLLIGAFVTHERNAAEIALDITLCLALGASAVQLSGKRSMRWPGIVLAGVTAFVLLLSTFRPTRALLVANWTLVTIAFGFISTSLFIYLGQPGQITRGRLHGLVSLYLMIATFFYGVFNLLETLNPASFSETSLGTGLHVSKHDLLYFSLTTLTTSGYGDILPLSHEARVFAALESVIGVLYIATTVARLVAAYTATDP